MSQIYITENIIVDMSMCLESFPCLHSVIVNGNEALYDGRDIYQMFKENNVGVHHHFSSYSPDKLKGFLDKRKS